MATTTNQPMIQSVVAKGNASALDFGENRRLDRWAVMFWNTFVELEAAHRFLDAALGVKCRRPGSWGDCRSAPGSQDPISRFGPITLLPRGWSGEGAAADL
ncbi:MAG: hypothetical protein EOO38_30425 [Cytophagaceae bacterium]|nr:MAG: hypothetical protein EOO38_30425 [Cytophagaceae bacterium]